MPLTATEELRAMLVAGSWSVEELAREAEVPRKRLTRALRGVMALSLGELERCAQILRDRAAQYECEETRAASEGACGADQTASF